MRLLVALFLLITPARAELIDPSFCGHIMEALRIMKDRPELTEQEKATKRKLEEWAGRAQCDRRYRNA